MQVGLVAHCLIDAIQSRPSVANAPQTFDPTYETGKYPVKLPTVWQFFGECLDNSFLIGFQVEGHVTKATPQVPPSDTYATRL